MIIPSCFITMRDCTKFLNCFFFLQTLQQSYFCFFFIFYFIMSSTLRWLAIKMKETNHLFLSFLVSTLSQTFHLCFLVIFKAVSPYFINFTNHLILNTRILLRCIITYISIRVLEPVPKYQ